MLRNLVTSLFEHEKVTTTDAKAKEVRKLAEKMVTLAKRGDLHARRQALRVIRSPGVVHKLFAEIGGRYTDRQGGYVRLTKTERRLGDAAPMSVVELLGTGEEKPAKKKGAAKKKTKAAAKKPAAKQKTKEAMEEIAADKAAEAEPDAKTQIAEPEAAEAKAEKPAAKSEAKDETEKPAAKKPAASKAKKKTEE